MSAHSKLKMSLIVVFSKIFDYDTREPKEILEPYGKALTLKMIAVMNSILQKKIIELEQEILLAKQDDDGNIFNTLNSKEKENLKLKLQDIISKIDFHLSS